MLVSMKMKVNDVLSSILISVQCLGWDRVAWTGQPVNFCRAGANQTLPSSTQIGLSVLPLAFVPSVLHSWRPKPPVPTRPLLPLNTQRCECCLLCHYHSPHCGVENILTGLYLWLAGVLVWIMKRTKSSDWMFIYIECWSAVWFSVCGLSR